MPPAAPAGCGQSFPADLHRPSQVMVEPAVSFIEPVLSVLSIDVLPSLLVRHKPQRRLSPTFPV